MNTARDGKHAGLIYLSRAIGSANVLYCVAAEFLSHEGCDVLAEEIEPLVLDFAARVEARLVECAPAMTAYLEGGRRELVEEELEEIDQNFWMLDRLRELRRCRQLRQAQVSASD